MKWQVWRQPGPRSLPDRVWRAMAAQFRLDVSQVSNMRYVEKHGTYAGRSVTYLRVFDPTVILDAAKAIRKYADLAGHSAAILFDGHVEKDGSVLLTDRRQPKAAPA